MFKLLIFACALASPCESGPERIEVLPIEWETYEGCVYAGAVLSEVYGVRAPGWRAELALCLPASSVEGALEALVGRRS